MGPILGSSRAGVSSRITDVAPDGSSVVIVGSEDVDSSDEAVANLSLDGAVELADEASSVQRAIYSPSGDTIVFSIQDGSTYEVLEYHDR